MNITLPPTPTCPPVLIIDGVKGGIGKSWVTRLVAHQLDGAHVPWVGVDGDNNNAHLARYHRFPDQVARSNAASPDFCNDLIDAMGNNIDAVVLVDLPAGRSESFLAEFETFEFAARCMKRPILKVFVMDALYDSVNQLRQTAERIPFSKTIVVLNGRVAKSRAEFDIWNSSATRTEFLECGGAELFVPPLHAPSVKFMEGGSDAGFLSFDEALALTDLPPSIQYNLQHYLLQISQLRILAHLKIGATS